MPRSRSPHRWVSRLAYACLTAVLVLLTGFAVFATRETSARAAEVTRADRLERDYGLARFDVSQEESLERKYRVEPGPEIRRLHAAAADDLDAALEAVARDGAGVDQRLVTDLLAAHAAYRGAIERLFAATDVGDTKLALAIDGGEVDPSFGKIEDAIYQRAASEEELATASIARLRSSGNRILVTTPIVFAIGLVMIGACGLVLRSTQRALRDEADTNRHHALHDALTGLPNRACLYDRTDQALRQAARDGTDTAVLLFDLDRFKEINDTLGHQCGDRVLCEIGPRIQSLLRESDTVARLGGDEFCVLLPRIDGVDAALAVAERVARVLEEPFVIDDVVLAVDASCGVALAPDHGDSAGLLLQRADVAMYLAKDSSVRVVAYSHDLDTNTPTRLALLAELKTAIAEDHLVLHYQPKTALDSRQVQGVEALVRWQHPRFGLLPPDDFLPIAEHTGLIRPLTTWVLDAALHQLRDWLDVAPGNTDSELSIAVNLSTRSLLDDDLPTEVAAALERWDIPARQLELEITETAIMADPTKARALLMQLAAIGVKLSIDDFGTGYSSLAYLKNLPVHTLKIDQSFVRHMSENPDDAIIVRSVVDLGHNLGLRTVAEGVEDAETWDQLCHFGCDSAQGFLLARPMPAAQLSAWLEATQHAPHPLGVASPT